MEEKESKELHTKTFMQQQQKKKISEKKREGEVMSERNQSL